VSMLLLSDVTKMLLTPRPWLGQFLAGGGSADQRLRSIQFVAKTWVVGSVRTTGPFRPLALAVHHDEASFS